MDSQVQEVADLIEELGRGEEVALSTEAALRIAQALQQNGYLARANQKSILHAVDALADIYDETQRYGGSAWGDVPVRELRKALADPKPGDPVCGHEAKYREVLLEANELVGLYNGGTVGTYRHGSATVAEVVLSLNDEPAPDDSECIFEERLQILKASLNEFDSVNRNGDGGFESGKIYAVRVFLSTIGITIKKRSHADSLTVLNFNEDVSSK